MGVRWVTGAVIGVLLAATTAQAHDARRPKASVAAATAAAAPAPCPGDPIVPDRVITGELAAEREGGYVLLPFQVPGGTTAVRVRYCYDEPDLNPAIDNTLDLGLYEPRDDLSAPWGIGEFRGWGGSSHPDVIVSPEGFTSAAQYEADPDRQVAGKTTRAFRPGPIPPGEWAAELGLAAIASQLEGDSDGAVAYRVEIELSDDPEFADEPYEPAPYDERPARSGPGWYAGDLHVHGEHSALGDAPLAEVFDYAFGPLEDGKAGLDFVALSDYVSGSSWAEVGRHQARYSGRLILRSAEVITYRGHANSHAATEVADYRHGPLYERWPDGTLAPVRDSRPARETFDRIHGLGGFTQINHPTIFPSPPFPPSLCRGCSWTYSSEETDYSKVDAIEIATGPAELGAPGRPGPNPFTVTGIQFWEDALAEGHKIAAVGSSDSHNAGRTPNPVTQAPIGTATTVVHADELSERGIQRAVEAGHSYVKVTGNDAPDLRFEARAQGSARAAIMGDTVRAPRVQFTARVLGGAPRPSGSDPGPYELTVFKDGAPLQAAVVTGDDFTLRFESSGLGRYRLQLQRGSVIEAVSSPIYLERAGDDPGGPAGGGGPGGPGGGGPAGSGGDGPRASGDEGPAGSGGDGPRAPRDGGPGGRGDGRQGGPTDDGAGARRGATQTTDGSADTTAQTGGNLPFTGRLLAPLTAAGVALLALGLLLRRRRARG